MGLIRLIFILKAFQPFVIMPKDLVLAFYFFNFVGIYERSFTSVCNISCIFLLICNMFFVQETFVRTRSHLQLIGLKGVESRLFVRQSLVKR